jgi:hypothetical protein
MPCSRLAQSQYPPLQGSLLLTQVYRQARGLARYVLLLTWFWPMPLGRVSPAGSINLRSRSRVSLFDCAHEREQQVQRKARRQQGVRVCLIGMLATCRVAC